MDFWDTYNGIMAFILGAVWVAILIDALWISVIAWWIWRKRNERRKKEGTDSK